MKTMTNIFTILVMTAAFASNAFAQPGNDNYASATTLISGASATCSQSTANSTTQTGEVTQPANTGAQANFSRSVWYSFQATAASMYVELEMTTLPSCDDRLGVLVYNNSTSIPASSAIRTTQRYNGDGAMVLNPTGLTVGQLYKVQVGYSNAGTCAINPTFCIKVGNTPPASSCAAPSTTGCGYSSVPTVTQIVNNCPIFDLNPLSDGGTTQYYCYNFVASSTTISFNMAIQSNCIGGNVTGLTWTLQRSSCGANVASGSLASMSASGLIIGQQYVLCYTYTVPSTCYHSSLYPYFVGASPLPMELTSFTGRAIEEGNIIAWETKTENGNDFFTVERSLDGQTWTPFAIVDGSGNTMAPTQYQTVDTHRENAIQYYRLSQTDFNGAVKVYEDKIISVDNREAGDVVAVKYIDLNGREVSEGENVSGIYLKRTEYVDGKIEVVKVFM